MLEEPLGLRGCQRHGWFVQDQQGGLTRQGSGDDDQPLLRNGQGAETGEWRLVNPKVREPLARCLPHAAAIDEPPASWQVTDEQVLGDAETQRRPEAPVGSGRCRVLPRQPPTGIETVRRSARWTRRTNLRAAPRQRSSQAWTCQPRSHRPSPRFPPSQGRDRRLGARASRRRTC